MFAHFPRPHPAGIAENRNQRNWSPAYGRADDASGGREFGSDGFFLDSHVHRQSLRGPCTSAPLGGRSGTQVIAAFLASRSAARLAVGLLLLSLISAAWVAPYPKEADALPAQRHR